MKAKTRSQRRGRTRKAGPREPNGQPQRPSVSEIRHATVEARMRQYGFTLVQAGDSLAGYEIGRLYLRGKLTLGDVQICNDYVKTVARHMALVNPGHPFPRAMDHLAAKGFGGEPPKETIDNIRNAYVRWLKPLTGEFADPAVTRHVMAFHDVAFFDNPVGDRLDSVKVCAKALRKEFGREEEEDKR